MAAAGAVRRPDILYTRNSDSSSASEWLGRQLETDAPSSHPGLRKAFSAGYIKRATNSFRPPKDSQHFNGNRVSGCQASSPRGTFFSRFGECPKGASLRSELEIGSRADRASALPSPAAIAVWPPSQTAPAAISRPKRTFAKKSRIRRLGPEYRNIWRPNSHMNNTLTPCHKRRMSKKVASETEMPLELRAR